jgi:vacuolar-type H+-ATPase subunit H
MSNEESKEKTETVIVEVVSETLDSVKENELKKETVALIEAIKTKAQSETQKAGEFARESYLDAVTKAREEIEKMDLFDPERIKEAMRQIENEAEKNWDSLVKEVKSFGDRLNEAAKAAWDKLTAPRD